MFEQIYRGDGWMVTCQLYVPLLVLVWASIKEVLGTFNMY